jgi:6-pyruvoyltetrahydropterin/6-carboxytetrahydropterin synthase
MLRFLHIFGEMKVARFANLEIHKEELSFSAGHFTIFSETERERLHGHNYYVSLLLNIKIEHNGLSFDYRYYKNKMLALCSELDRHFLLPSLSPYLKLVEKENCWLAYFNQQEIPFLKEDVIVLPIANTTIEELSHWFLQHLLKDSDQLEHHAIYGIEIKVYNGPGQSSGASWERSL